MRLFAFLALYVLAVAAARPLSRVRTSSSLEKKSEEGTEKCSDQCIDRRDPKAKCHYAIFDEDTCPKGKDQSNMFCCTLTNEDKSKCVKDKCADKNRPHMSVGYDEGQQPGGAGLVPGAAEELEKDD